MQSYIKYYWYKMPCGLTIPADSPENVACLPGWSQSGVFSRVVSLSNDCIRRYFLALSRVLKDVSSLNIHLFISSSGSLVHKVRLHQSVSSASQIIMRRKLPEPCFLHTAVCLTITELSPIVRVAMSQIVYITIGIMCVASITRCR